MLRTVIQLTLLCNFVKSSGVAVAPLASSGTVAAVGSPVVTAASSQYFERTFNRLVVPQVIAPAPVVPPPSAPVFPVAPTPTVFVEPTRPLSVFVNPQQQQPPPQPLQPNVAIAVATAHAAAPVATILLPPYPFGFPPTFGFVPSEQPINIPDENTKEPTTTRTTETEATTTPEPITTTPIDASSSDNNIVQALPSNENVNLQVYGPPQPARPQYQQPLQPQKPNGQFQPQAPNLQFQTQQQQLPQTLFKPHLLNMQFQNQNPNLQFRSQQPNLQLPLQNQSYRPMKQQEFPPYPPSQQAAPQNLPVTMQPRPQYSIPSQQSWSQQKGRPQKLKTSVEVVPVPLAYITPPPLHKTHAHVKVLKHIYSFVPASSAKIVLKPVKLRPVRLVKHKIVGVRLQNRRADDRDIEMTTLNPFPRPSTKPPRIFV